MKIERIIEPKKNKKGSILDLFIWMVVAFVIVLFFGIWIYGYGILSDTMSNMNLVINISNTGYGLGVNVSATSDQTLGVVNSVQKNALHSLAFIMIVMMGLTIFLTNFLVKSHPAFFIVYVIVVIAAIICSVYISNQYESLMSNEVLGETLSEFTGASFIMLSLPLWVAVIGIFAAMFLFMGIIRDSGAGGSVV